MQSTEPARQDVLKEEPREIAERASDVGERRLDRSNLDILITSFIGGAEVSLGGLAAMTVVGSAQQAVSGLGLYPALALGGLAFPIGFLFVITDIWLGTADDLGVALTANYLPVITTNLIAAVILTPILVAAWDPLRESMGR